MNKKLKIATAAVAVVMAGTMAFGMFGCGGGGGGGESGKTYDNTVKTATEKTTTSAAEIVTKLNAKNLASHVGAKQSAFTRLKNYASSTTPSGGTKQETYTVETRADTDEAIDFPMDIGDNANRTVAYNDKLLTSDGATLPDGKHYDQDSLKPAWANVATKLNLNITDKYTDKGNSNGKIAALSTSETTGNKLEDRVIITDSVDQINQNSAKLLDLSNYLDQMPNYKAFLEANSVVRVSLTSDTNTGAMYAAPYFDGYNDIEKYVLCKTNWVEALLDNTTGGNTNVTYRNHANEKGLENTVKTSITSYMGKTGKYNVSVLDKDGAVVTAGIDVNYDAALAAAKSETAPLGVAVSEAAGVAYTGTSGNIVDILNFVIDTKDGDVAGAQILKITQEYIKVAYCVGGTTTSFYTQSGYKLSDVFVGNSAAWDVDLYAALGRCLVTNPSLIKSGKEGASVDEEDATALANVYLCANRQGNMQRMIDQVSFVGELYGIRGLESRNLYSYIDAKGQLQDPRSDEATYEAFKAFHAFYAEGLVSDTGSGNNGQTSYHSGENNVEALSYHDYSNTQTPAGFELDGAVSAGTYDIEEGYNFTSIITPVSKWDADSDTNHTKETVMRFTESWRSVKDTGFAVPVDAVKNNPKKLKAVLEFIDYMFSDDGMIELTYGPMASDANSTGGFWYNPEATQTQIEAGQYFEYNGKKYYSDVFYAGKYQPMVTQKVKDLYYGKTVNGLNVSKSSAAANWVQAQGCARDYTAFARHVLGTATNVGNKLQSFEYQMTSEMGISGAKLVSNAIDKGIINHVVPEMTGGTKGTWYACVPTLLPYTEAEKTTNTGAPDVADFGATHYFTNNSKATTNLFWEIIKYGYDASKYVDTYSNLGLTKS